MKNTYCENYTIAFYEIMTKRRADVIQVNWKYLQLT